MLDQEPTFWTNLDKSKQLKDINRVKYRIDKNTEKRNNLEFSVTSEGGRLFVVAAKLFDAATFGCKFVFHVVTWPFGFVDDLFRFF